MEKSRKAKKSVLIVLLLLVIGLTIGFSAFISELTISSSATVKGDSQNFKVAFSESETELTGNTATTSGSATSGGNFTGTELTGLKANFTQPGQTATWTVYAYNAGQFDAFLNDVTVGKITGKAGEGTTQSYVDEAIKGISVSVNVKNVDYKQTTSGISNHKLEQGKGEAIAITLTYAADSAIADGDFTVNIGDIKLNYESVD